MTFFAPGRGDWLHPERSLRAHVLERITADQLAQILDITEDGIITVDVRQEVLQLNHGAAKIFGYSPEEVVGRALEFLLPARFQPAHRGQVEEFARSTQTARPMADRREVYGRRKDGTEFPAEISISKFGAGAGQLFTAIVRDVTERRRHEANERELERLRGQTQLAEAEATAREREIEYRRIVETANEGIWVLDPEARITFVNARMAELLGHAPEELVGRQKWDFLFDEDQTSVRTLFERRRQGVSEQADVRFCHHTGSAVWTLMSARPMIDERGRVRGALDMFTDVTERKKAESAVRETSEQRERALADLQKKTEELRSTTQQLWQAAKLAGVGELAASIAHELNNPLGIVSLRLETVLSKTPAQDPRRKLLEVIDGEVERMAALVANLLQFSRAGRDQVSTVDVCEEVNRTIDLVSHHLRKRGVRVSTDFARGVPTIHADRNSCARYCSTCSPTPRTRCPTAATWPRGCARPNSPAASRPSKSKLPIRARASRRSTSRACSTRSLPPRKRGRERGWVWPSADASWPNTKAPLPSKARSAGEPPFASSSRSTPRPT
jgi:PAS domain S-box-containing protein